LNLCGKMREIQSRAIIASMEASTNDAGLLSRE
jgi:hypothetical protein